MLSLNKITINGSEGSISDIYSKLNAASVESDIANYHSMSSDKSLFVGIFFDPVTDFEFEWAYVESCEIAEGGILSRIYSYNGNLAEWASRLRDLYAEDESMHVLTEVEKSVKFVNYEVERDWEYGEYHFPEDEGKKPDDSENQ